MKKCRKILLILAAAVFAFALFALTACGGGDEDEGDKVSVSLDKPTLTLTEGETATLTATVKNSEEAVEWKVSDNTVVTIAENGKSCTVTAAREGTATVTASIGEVSATCSVTVTADENGGGDEDEVSISLDKTSLTIKEGETATLTATVKNSEEAVEWTVSDNTVVTIAENGKSCTVTAAREGTATVTASIGEVSATCSVTVMPESEIGGGDEDKDGDENLPKITEWGTVGDPIYGFENGASIWHHIYLNDNAEKKYDFDSYEVVKVTLDGAQGEVIETQVFDANVAPEHMYHMQIHIRGTKYQTTVITIAFKKDGETVATGTYTREGDKELILSEEDLKISKDATEPATVSIIRVNGNTELSGLKISWSIDKTDVATITDNENGTVTITAVAEGTATLTCTIGEGKNAFSETCTITVVEGEVKEEQPLDVSDQLHQQEVYGAWNINIRLDCDAELGGKIDSVEVTAIMDGEPANVTVHEVYGTNPKYIKMGVSQDWTHTYVFTINYKNAGGKVIATGTFTREADKSLKLDVSTLNLELGVTESGTITATVSNNVTGSITWSIDDEGVATIADNGDGTITVTAVAEGRATITATVDGLTQTCTVNVVKEGETVTVPTVTNARIHEVYGGDVHCGVILEGSDEFASTYAEVLASFAYVKVNGVKNNDMKDMFAFGADGSYRVNVFMGGAVQTGVDYVFELCDKDDNVLLRTVALQWNG